MSTKTFEYDVEERRLCIRGKVSSLRELYAEMDEVWDLTLVDVDMTYAQVVELVDVFCTSDETRLSVLQRLVICGSWQSEVSMSMAYLLQRGRPSFLRMDPVPAWYGHEELAYLKQLTKSTEFVFATPLRPTQTRNKREEKEKGKETIEEPFSPAIGARLVCIESM